MKKSRWKKKKPTTQSSEESSAATPKATPSVQTSAAKSAAGGAKEVDFTMKLSGSYSDLVNFLRGVESSSRLISIENLAIQMNTETGTQQTAALSAQIKGMAYYKPEVSLEATLANITVDQETVDKFFNLKTFGSPINLPTESGFGRNNPFENY